MDEYDYRVFRKEIFTPVGTDALVGIYNVAESMLKYSGALKGFELLNRFALHAHPMIIRAAIDYLEEIGYLRRISGKSTEHAMHRFYAKGQNTKPIG